MTGHHIDEDAVRQRAYALWDEEGRPEGAAERHWDTARAELEAAAPGPDAAGEMDDAALEDAGMTGAGMDANDPDGAALAGTAALHGVEPMTTRRRSRA